MGRVVRIVSEKRIFPNCLSSLPESKANASIFFTINDYNAAKATGKLLIFIIRQDDFLGQVKISLLALIDEAKKIGHTLDKV